MGMRKGFKKPRPDWTYRKLDQLVREVLDLHEDTAFRSQNTSFRVVRAIFETIKKALRKEEHVYIAGLGTFRVKTRAPKLCGDIYFSDHKTLSHVKAIHPAHKVVVFKPAKALKNALKESHAD
jgi:nucleoid DNA-binding protein